MRVFILHCKCKKLSIFIKKRIIFKTIYKKYGREIMEKAYKFKEYGDQLRFDYCPVCKSEGDNPDFTLNKKTGDFYCHREGKGGKFHQLREYDEDFYNFAKTIIKIGSKKKTTPKVNLDEAMRKRGSYFLNKEWIGYLKGRGIGEKYLKNLFRLGKNKNMMIPITDGKKVVAIKYRGLNKEMSCEVGSSGNYFINWQHIVNRDYLIIVEGEIDLLSALEVGFENVVSLPFGAHNVRAVKNQKKWIGEFEKIIIAVDNDEAGEKCYSKILEELKEIHHKLYRVYMGKYKDFNEILVNESGEKLKEVIENCVRCDQAEEEIFFQGENGYLIKDRGEIIPLTDFLLEIKGFSDGYILGVSYNMGSRREFRAKKTELLLPTGIVQYLGYYFASPNTIASFWSWILKENEDKFIGEIDHYGIVGDNYYDKASKIICDKNDLAIQNIENIPDLTKSNKMWLRKNLIFLRKDINQSLLGVCWALGRIHISEGSYPILELAGTTSAGKTEYAEFIVRLLFGTKENIKSLGTLTLHQIRSISSCSNITPWVMDEVKIVGRNLKEKADYFASTIRSIYDNKTINQGNTKNRLYEFKLCTPFIISGETKINDVSIKNRVIPVQLKTTNKGDYQVFEKFKYTDILERLGKAILKQRLEKGAIIIPENRIRDVFPDVIDERQLHNIKCVYIGFRALDQIVKFDKEVKDSFVKFLSKVANDGANPVRNFLALLGLLAESDKDCRLFYQVKDGKHYIWFSMVYKGICEEHFRTNSTLELLDMDTLRQQLKEIQFIIRERVSVRFPIDSFSKKTRIVSATEIQPISIFDFQMKE